MLGRVTDPAPQQDAEEQPVGKGRPTPKRSDARKRRRNAAPVSRKEAARLRRERLREQRHTQRQALLTGDERNLPPRDAGPARRLARDYVDRRFTFGQVFFGMVFVALGVTLTPNRTIAGIANLLLLLLFGSVVWNSVVIGRHARQEVEDRYGVEATTGITSYAAMRAMQPRRMRRPPPRVKRGGEPV
jgi:hypothetical protein